METSNSLKSTNSLCSTIVELVNRFSVAIRGTVRCRPLCVRPKFGSQAAQKTEDHKKAKITAIRVKLQETEMAKKVFLRRAAASWVC